MGRWIKRLFLLLILALTLLYFTRNWVGKWALERALSEQLGSDVRIQEISLNLQHAYLWVQGIQVSNPRDYPDRLFARIPEAFLEWNWRALWNRVLYIPRMGVNIDELVVVKTPSGGSNLAYFYERFHGPSASARARSGRQEVSEKWKVQIGSLGLSFRQLVFRDYSRGTPPQIQIIPLNTGQHVVSNLRGMGDLVGVIALRVLSIRAIGSVGLDPSLLQQDLGTVEQRVQSVRGILQQLQELFR